jgi:hypothetical protein
MERVSIWQRHRNIDPSDPETMRNKLTEIITMATPFFPTRKTMYVESFEFARDRGARLVVDGFDKYRDPMQGFEEGFRWLSLALEFDRATDAVEFVLKYSDILPAAIRSRIRKDY